MKNLYLKSLTRLSNQLGTQDMLRAHLPELEKIIVTKYGKSLKAKDMIRLPEKELRTMLKAPCPVGNSFRKQDIEIFKKLRLTYNISQTGVCSKCPNSKNCPFKDQPAAEEKRAKLEHLVYFLMRLKDRKQSQFSILRWTSAYKVCTSLSVMLADFISLKKQILLYNQIVSALPPPKIEVKAKPSQDIYSNRRFHLTPFQRHSKKITDKNERQPYSKNKSTQKQKPQQSIQK